MRCELLGICSAAEDAADALADAREKKQKEAEEGRGKVLFFQDLWRVL